MVDLQTGTVGEVYALGELGLKKEPEMIGFDPADGNLYYVDAAGGWYLMTLKE